MCSARRCVHAKRPSGLPLAAPQGRATREGGWLAGERLGTVLVRAAVPRGTGPAIIITTANTATRTFD
eukprot:2627926-Rhodomonas_salina.1